MTGVGVTLVGYVTTTRAEKGLARGQSVAFPKNNLISSCALAFI